VIETADVRKEISVSEDLERKAPEADIQQQDEGEDVEGHGFQPQADDKVTATEEGPDVEAHKLIQKKTP
jgi:hypothetical protein